MRLPIRVYLSALLSPSNKVHDYAKWMALMLSKNHIFGENPVLIIVRLNRFVRKTNTRAITDALTAVSLPSFFQGLAESRYDAEAEMLSTEKGDISVWSEAVQYLLNSYNQSPRISSATADLRTMFRGPLRTEREPTT